MLLGGDITVNSKFGQGSIFTISLPTDIIQDKEQVHTSYDQVLTPPVITPVPEKKQLPIVLLVDDDDMCRILTENMLLNVVELDYAATGAAGLQRIKERNYAAILLDINLKSGLSGLDVMNEIKLMENYNDIPVIAITAYAMLGDKEMFLSHGFRDYIAKPFTGNKLSAIMAKWLKD